MTRRMQRSTASSEKPKRALVISFAANHCKPCKKELPELKKVAASYSTRGVQFALVVIDKEKDALEQMRKLTVDQLKLPLPVLADRLALVGRRYGADVLPLSVVIGADARIRWFKAGYTETTMAELQAQLDQVAEPLPAPPEPPAKKKKKKKRKKKRTKK